MSFVCNLDIILFHKHCRKRSVNSYSRLRPSSHISSIKKSGCSHIADYKPFSSYSLLWLCSYSFHLCSTPNSRVMMLSSSASSFSLSILYTNQFGAKSQSIHHYDFPLASYRLFKPRIKPHSTFELTVKIYILLSCLYCTSFHYNRHIYLYNIYAFW